MSPHCKQTRQFRGVLSFYNAINYLTVNYASPFGNVL
jgi:hypothetical protein